jgi:NAD(P) transhydrogenase subunit beta
MELNILTICYLIGAITFILGLKMLSHPEKARKGNLLAAFGMTVAIFGTIFLYKDDAGNKLHNYGWIFGGIFIGGVIGTLAAKKVKMTAMPEMVSMFNGMGGACAAIISIVEFNHLLKISNLEYYGRGMGKVNFDGHIATLLIIVLGCIIGCVSFAGSMIAWGKLNGKIKDFTFKGQHLVNIGLLIVIVGLAVYLISNQEVFVTANFYLIVILSLLYGVMFVFPIGGADIFTQLFHRCGGCLWRIFV